MPFARTLRADFQLFHVGLVGVAVEAALPHRAPEAAQRAQRLTLDEDLALVGGADDLGRAIGPGADVEARSRDLEAAVSGGGLCLGRGRGDAEADRCGESQLWKCVS